MVAIVEELSDAIPVEVVSQPPLIPTYPFFNLNCQESLVIKVTGSGKIRRLKGRRSHLRRRKRKQAKRLFDKTIPLETAGEVKRVRRLAPYLKKR